MVEYQKRYPPKYTKFICSFLIAFGTTAAKVWLEEGMSTEKKDQEQSLVVSCAIAGGGFLVMLLLAIILVLYV